MSLLARDFERQARALHRAELERSPELRAEFKRLRKSESSAINRATRHFVMPMIWSGIFLNILWKSRDVSLAASVITLWAAATAFRWGSHWFQQFYASEELVVLNHLPLNDRQIFRFQTARYLSVAGWTFWEFLLGYAALGILAGASGGAWVNLAFAAIAQCVLIFAIALHAASRLHMLPLNALAVLFYATAFAVLMMGAQEMPGARYIVQASNWFLPTGWLNYVLLQAQGDQAILALLLPIAGIVYLARFSWARLRGFYSLEGLEILPSQGRNAPDLDDEELTGASFGNRPGPTEIEDRVAARSFLLGVNWESTGWLERFVSRVLNPRERVITEFLVAQDPGWTRSFRWSFWVWLVSCAMVMLLGRFSGTVVFFAAYILATASLPLFGGDWRGMRHTQAGGVNLPGFALYPISFNSIAWIFFKVNIIRILGALPFLLSFAAVAAWTLNEKPIDGLRIGAELLGIFLALQPLLVLLPISSATNDTSRMRAIWWLVFLPILLALCASAAGVFLTDGFLEMVSCHLLILMLSALLFAVYRRAYRSGRFDLFNLRNPQPR